MIVLDEQHLISVLAEFVRYYNADRPHRTLGMHTPERKPRLTTGPIRSHSVLNGLHHVYEPCRPSAAEVLPPNNTTPR